MRAVVNEVAGKAVGAKIEKIFQPGRDTVLLHLRTGSGTARLLLSAASGSARLGFTENQPENPATPPMFCMLLRKHLGGGRVTAVEQMGLERVVRLHISCRDDMGFPVERQLIVEIMGKWSNLILVDETGRILDCIHKSSGAEQSMRSMLPGLFYRDPDPQDKLDFTALSNEEISALAASPTRDLPADRWLQETFLGISPLISRECAASAGVDAGAYLSELTVARRQDLAAFAVALKQRVNSNAFTPVMLVGEEPRDFSFMELHQYDGTYCCKRYPTFSALLEDFYAERDRAAAVRLLGRDVVKTMTSARDRTKRRLMHQKKELAESLDRERLRICGDLITANLYRMERGMHTLEAENFYDPEGGTVRIKLDPAKTPQQNAAAYYKDYTRAKTAETVLTEQIRLGEEDLDYIESVLDALSRAEGEQDVAEIREELIASGYLRPQRGGKKQAKRPRASEPLSFTSTAGLRILVGKNNTQNDRLTTKQAAKNDYWFHTQKIHGSHVILCTEGSEPDRESILEAARLAAWFSQGRGGSNVPVDYTRVRNVKKPAGARAGMVVYESYHTAYVTPEASLAEQLRDGAQT